MGRLPGPALAGLVLIGCGTPVDEGPAAPIEVKAWATDQHASGGMLVIQTTHDAGLTVSLPSPEVEGLTFTDEGLTTESLGGRMVLTQRFRFTGKKGFYEVPPLVVSAGDVSGESRALWLDLGVQGPNADKLADIDDPGAVWTLPVGWICGGMSVAGLMTVGLGYGFVRVLRKPRKKPVRLVPPDVRCLRAWEAVRADTALSDDDKAKELSRIFREYVEEVLAFPAVSWTSTEILARLEGMQHLPAGNVPRAKKLLRATDLVKYAEVSPEADFFDDMDADLRAFVSSTRPRSWSPEGAGDA
ncbi:MAG: hypothetical protein H6737_00625 [Alphaproteobacteria bacterium]|nr:hypothetical protein [Alphaproteobacteria bacterium]